MRATFTSPETFTGSEDSLISTDTKFSDDGRRLGALRKDGTLTIYDALNGHAVASIAGVRDSQFNRDGTRVVTVASREDIRDDRPLSFIPITFGLLIAIFLGMRPASATAKPIRTKVSGSRRGVP